MKKEKNKRLKKLENQLNIFCATKVHTISVKGKMNDEYCAWRMFKTVTIFAAAIIDKASYPQCLYENCRSKTISFLCHILFSPSHSSNLGYNFTSTQFPIDKHCNSSTLIRLHTEKFTTINAKSVLSFWFDLTANFFTAFRIKRKQFTNSPTSFHSIDWINIRFFSESLFASIRSRQLFL